MADLVKASLEKLKSIKFFAYSIIVFLAIVGIANLTDAFRKIGSFTTDTIAYFKNQQLNDIDLTHQSETTAQQLLIMVRDRQLNEPSFNFNKWTFSVKQSIQYSQETNYLYMSKFSGKVSFLRNEFIKRGIRNNNLDLFYQHPTNYFGYSGVAIALSEMAVRLNKGKNITTK